MQPVQLKVLPDENAPPVAGSIKLGRRNVYVQPDQVQATLLHAVQVSLDLLGSQLGKIQPSDVARAAHEKRDLVDLVV